MTCHQPVSQTVLSDVPPPHYPHMPLNAPRERHLVAKSGTNWGLVDLRSCSIVCNRLSWLFKSTLQYIVFIFICTPQCPLRPPKPPVSPQWPPPQYRHLVVKGGTTVSQHYMSSACGSGCCFVRCTPIPHVPPGRGILWPRVVLT